MTTLQALDVLPQHNTAIQLRQIRSVKSPSSLLLIVTVNSTVIVDLNAGVICRDEFKLYLRQAQPFKQCALATCELPQCLSVILCSSSPVIAATAAVLLV